VTAYKTSYLNNLLPSALRAQSGYDAKKVDSYVCPRSRAWVSKVPEEQLENVFNIAGLILNEKMLELIEYMFPGILSDAEDCWRNSLKQHTSTRNVVVSETNKLVSEALVYCAMVWCQVRNDGLIRMINDIIV
jgi:hypothetical protein